MASSSPLHTAECPICFDFLRQPIYICNTGHSLCANCKNGISSCPICGAAMSMIRNYTLESVLEELWEAKKRCCRLEDIYSNKEIIKCISGKFSFTQKSGLIRYPWVENCVKTLFYDNTVFKLHIKVAHIEGVVYFAMQIAGSDLQKATSYTFELDYIPHIRKNKFSAKVSNVTDEQHVFRSNLIKISKELLFKPNMEFQVFGRFID